MSDKVLTHCVTGEADEVLGVGYFGMDRYNLLLYILINPNLSGLTIFESIRIDNLHDFGDTVASMFKSE